MNQKLKYVGLIAIIPLFLIAVSPSAIDAADAYKSEGSPGTVSPKSYGSATSDVVYSDRLCGESNFDTAMTATTANVTYEDCLPTCLQYKLSR